MHLHDGRTVSSSSIPFCRLMAKSYSLAMFSAISSIQRQLEASWKSFQRLPYMVVDRCLSMPGRGHYF